MYFPVHIVYQNIQERYKQPEKDETRLEVTAIKKTEWQKPKHWIIDLKRCIAGNPEYRPYNNNVEDYLQIQFQELLNSDCRFAHKITSYQYKTIDSSFTPHPENIVEQRV